MWCPEDKVVSGAFGEYVVANERNCVVLPDQIDFIDGPFFACVGTTAYAALRRLGVEQYFPQTIAVYGPGTCWAEHCAHCKVDGGTGYRGRCHGGAY